MLPEGRWGATKVAQQRVFSAAFFALPYMRSVSSDALNFFPS